MPEVQYKLIAGLSNTFNVLVLEDDISVSSSLASGLIQIKFEWCLICFQSLAIEKRI